MNHLPGRPPQEQMERLLSAAVNHDIGATEMIEEKVADWHGHLARSKQGQGLGDTALYSNDLRARPPPIKIELAVHQGDKRRQTAIGRRGRGGDHGTSRPLSAWGPGTLANR